MATRGRKPKPAELKILEGSRRDRVEPDSPLPIRELPECPHHLVDDDEAREEWDRMVALLDRMGVLSQTDGAALSIYCSIYSRWVKAKAELKAGSLTIATDNGGEKTNPAVGIAERCEAQMRAYLTEFGCTPSSRGRLKTGGEKKRDRLSEFQARRPAR